MVLPGSAELTALAHPTLPIVESPSELPSLRCPKAAQRTLSLLQCYSSAKTFLLCERSKENKHLHLSSAHIQPNMHGIFIVEGSDL